jgi:hypothetical protein
MDAAGVLKKPHSGDSIFCFLDALPVILFRNYRFIGYE